MTGLGRDRLTWLVYVQLATYGFFLYGFGPTVPLLREEQDVSRAVAGLHGTALAVGALLASFVAAVLVRRLGRAAVLWGGLAVLCAGIAVYASSTLVAVTLAGAVVASFGGSFVVMTSAAALSDRHGPAAPAAISEANALAAGVGATAPLVVGVSVGLGLGWRPALLLVLPAVVVLALVARRQHVTVPAPTEAPPRPDGSRRLPARYWIGWGVLTCGIAIEFCMALWTADLLRNRYDLGAGLAAAGLTLVVGGMCVGRVVGARLALRVPVDTLLYGAIAVCLLGFAVFWSSPWAALAIPGLFVAGLGIALFYPLGIARAIDASEGRPDLASARAGLGAALASGGGPFLLGALADQFGIHRAFLVVPALLALAALGVRLGGRSALVTRSPGAPSPGEPDHQREDEQRREPARDVGHR